MAVVHEDQLVSIIDKLKNKAYTRAVMIEKLIVNEPEMDQNLAKLYSMSADEVGKLLINHYEDRLSRIREPWLYESDEKPDFVVTGKKGQTGTKTHEPEVKVELPPAPVVSRFEFESDPTESEPIVGVVIGRNFTKDSVVLANGREARSDFVSSREIEFSLRAQKAGTTIGISVLNPGKPEQESRELTFTVKAAPKAEEPKDEEKGKKKDKKDKKGKKAKRDEERREKLKAQLDALLVAKKHAVGDTKELDEFIKKAQTAYDTAGTDDDVKVTKEVKRWWRNVKVKLW